MNRVAYLTGFGPFPGVAHNPTAALARALDGRAVAGLRVVADVLDVAWPEAGERVRQRYSELRPTVVLHLGVAMGADRLRVERRAANRLDFRVPDVNGQIVCGESIARGAPGQHDTDLPIALLARHLRRIGLPAVVSRDAGRYLCNAIWWCARDSRGPALFLHVPEIATPRPDRRGAWTEPDLLRGVEATLRWLIGLRGRESAG